MTTVWKPHVTVAAVLERDGRYLLVEEQTEDGILLNQPAGHLEADESIVDGAVRETLEESAYRFRPDAMIGVYRWAHPGRDVVYLRFAFSGPIVGHDPDRTLDTGILRALWLTPAQIRDSADRHRSPLVLRCVEDHLAGRRYPLDLLTHYP